MELTKDKIANDYKEFISGRKYWLILLIMTPIFLLIGGVGGNIFAGLFMLVLMIIYMICSTASSNKALKKLRKGDFRLCRDVITDKSKATSYKHRTTTFKVKSEKLYQKGYKVLSCDFDEVEIGQPFVAVYAGKKFIRFYNLATNTISPELMDRVE